MKKPKSKVDKHLGGHSFKTHIDNGILNYAKDKLDCKSMLDIGCGPGGIVDAALALGIDSYGIDGDYSLTHNHPERITIHDFTKGKINHTRSYDLGYSCEFVEHVEEQYLPNFINSFQQCRHLIITYAPEGTPGHHHVNCRNQEYWINILKEFNFAYDPIVTNYIRKVSTMKRNFIRDHGLYFLNTK
jgi:cyclopropane fatty-acyl-phospholipid synthase-like methyltransferase